MKILLLGWCSIAVFGASSTSAFMANVQRKVWRKAAVVVGSTPKPREPNKNRRRKRKGRPQNNNSKARISAKMRHVSMQQQQERRELRQEERESFFSSMNAGISNRLMIDMMFELIDTNNDGGITTEELVKYLKSEGILEEDEVSSNPSIKYLFTVLDQNSDGLISREELQFAFDNYETPALYSAFGLGNRVTDEVYASAIADIRHRGHHEAPMVDRENDSDDDDKSYSPELLTKLADFIFDLIDTNQSGEIDVDELRQHFMEQLDRNTMSLLPDSDGDDQDDEPNEKVDSILEALDIDEDGVISREEMRKAFQQYDPKALSEALGLPVL